MVEGKRGFKMLTYKPRGKRPLGKHRIRCEDNIGINLKEIIINRRNWVDFSEDRYFWRALVNPDMKLRVP